MQTIFWILIFFGTFFIMEFNAWFTHKYVMHGFGWFLHKDHHHPHDNNFEKNDFYFVSLHKIDDKLDIQILNTVKKAIKSHDRKH